MSTFTRVEFKAADGTTLRGNYYRAAGENRPIFVMTAGLQLVKEHFTDAYAEAYQEAGISALVFDTRNYGSSEGTPRYETNLFDQAEDYRDAVTAAMRLPGVDPKKVIVWGVGHAGAGAIIATAEDPRPAALVLMSPIISGREDSKHWPAGWVERARQDRADKATRGDTTPTYVQAWPESEEQAAGEQVSVFHGPQYQFIKEAGPRAAAAGTPWENKITLRSLLNVWATEPKDFIYKIQQPTFYAVFPEDPFTGTSDYHKKNGFDRFGKNAEFHIVQPTGEEHASFLPFLLTAMKSHIDFVKRTLGA